MIATRIRVITVDPGQVLTASAFRGLNDDHETDGILQEFTVIRNRGDEASADKVYE